MAQIQDIRIESGRRKFRIIDEYDQELGIVEIDLADSGIIARSEEAEKKIDEIVKKVSSLSEDAENNVEAIIALDKEIKEWINYIFDYDVSSNVFGKSNCLVMIDGSTFAERFLEAFDPVMKAIFKEQEKSSKKRMSKYVPRDHQRAGK